MTKLALIIGINYTGTNSALNGCINDATALKKLLTEQFNYEESNITFLTDDTPKKPTGDNIIQSLYELALRSQREEIEEIWISYSGHGYYIRDSTGDETDGKDEVIVPIDYQTKGLVSDDMFNHVLSFVNQNTKVIALFDACHSGTILDLQYRYISGDFNVKESEIKNVKADALLISGCRDDQTSADAYNLEKDGKYSGAMTSSFLDTMKKFDYDIPCFKLLKHMRMFLQENNFQQIPQMTCTFPITHTTAFAISKKQHTRPFLKA